MATLASRFDSQTIEHYSIRWNQDLSGQQRAAIASEIERERYYPEFAWLKPADLFVDEAYQRPLSEERVWQIATQFTWKLFNPLWVGKRGDKLFVVDGRHRLAAASILGSKLIPLVPAEVRRTANVKEEAGIFIDLQDKRRRVSSAQRFAARLIKGDQMALDLNAIVTRHKFKIESERFGGRSLFMSNPALGQNEITAVGTLEKLYRAGGKQRVSTVLQIIRDAWDGVSPTTGAFMLRALNRVLEKTEKKPEVIARKLGAKDPWGLIERGQRFAHSNMMPIAESMSEVLLRVIDE